MFWVTKRICLSLQRRDRDTVLHGRETGTIVRTADGQFFERHETARRATSAGCWCSTRPWRRSSSRSAVDENGVAAKHARSERLRARLSRFYFDDRVNPVTPAELAAAHHHGEHEAIDAGASGSLEGPPETQGLGLPMSERESVERAPEKDLWPASTHVELLGAGTHRGGCPGPESRAPAASRPRSRACRPTPCSGWPSLGA